MPVDSIQSLVNNTQQSASPASANKELDREAFMKLLVAELRHQDPLDPMDAREMVTQLSELTSVEKLGAIEHKLGLLEVGIASLANTQTASLVGRQVKAMGGTANLGPTGPASIGFQTGARAQSITVTLRDAAGNQVRTLELGDTFPGNQRVQWDGNDANGERASVGTYRAEINAVDSNGVPVAVDSSVSGVVSGVSYESGFPELVVGEVRIMLGDVVSISE